MSNSFKYASVSSETNGRVDIDRRRTETNRMGHNQPALCELSERETKQATAFFSWLADYRRHSDTIGHVMKESWGKPTIFAFCEYKNGRLVKNAPMEPQVKHARLVMRHLIKGYPQIWEFYQNAKAESIQICNQIGIMMANYEQKIDNEIGRGLTLVKEENITKIPREWDSQSHYDYHKVYDEIFRAESYRKNKRLLWIKDVSNYKYLVSGLSLYEAGEPLAYGRSIDMQELQERIRSLHVNPEITDIIASYHTKINELNTNDYKRRYFSENERIWRGINENADLLKGHGACETLSECAVPP